MDEGEAGSAEAVAALGAVLAGGAGRRLGGAKATVELAGRPLIEHPLAALRAARIEAVVVAKPRTPLPPLDCEIVREAEEPRHPLLGIVAALRRAAGRPVVAVACDMPLVPAALLDHLASARDPLLVAAPGDRPQPLLGRYAAELLPDLEAALPREEPLRRTVALLSPRLLGTRELSRFGDPERMLVNVNDEADLRRASALLAPG